jgi:hypothetical protein
MKCGGWLRSEEKTSFGDSQLMSDGVVFVLKHDRSDGHAEGE